MSNQKKIIYMLDKDQPLIDHIKEALKNSSFTPEILTVRQTPEPDSLPAFDLMLFKASWKDFQWMQKLIEFNQLNKPMILYIPDFKEKLNYKKLSKSSVYIINNLNRLNDLLIMLYHPKPEQEKVILFVDDDLYILQSYRRALYKTPWKIMTVLSGDEALSILDKKSVDLLITDIKMPSLHGIDLISKIRQIHEELPIIVCSGFNGLKKDPELVNHRISDFLEKPVQPELLSNKITSIFAANA